MTTHKTLKQLDLIKKKISEIKIKFLILNDTYETQYFRKGG